MGVVAISPIYRKVSVGDSTIEFHEGEDGVFQSNDLTDNEQIALVGTKQFVLTFTEDYSPMALEVLRSRYTKYSSRDIPGYTNEYDFPPYNKPRIHTLQNRRTA